MRVLISGAIALLSAGAVWAATSQDATRDRSAYGMSAASGPEHYRGVTILTDDREAVRIGQGLAARASRRIGPFAADAVVLVYADGESEYSGEPVDAALRVKIDRDGKTILSEDRPPSLVVARTAMATGATTRLFLPKGETALIAADVVQVGAARAEDTRIRALLHVVAIAATS
jgi:hypothetical protein